MASRTFYDYIEAVSGNGYFELDTSRLTECSKVKISYLYAPKANSASAAKSFFEFGISKLSLAPSSETVGYLIHYVSSATKIIGRKDFWSGSVTFKDVIVGSDGIRSGGPIVSNNSGWGTNGNWRVLGTQPDTGMRTGVFEFLDTTGTTLMKLIPCVQTGTAGYYDQTSGVFYAPTSLQVTPGNFAESWRTYRLNATVSEQYDIALAGAVVNRFEDGQMTREIYPESTGGDYTSRGFTCTDTVNSEQCQWVWGAGDIYGNTGTDTVTLDVTDRPDFFWLRNDADSDDKLAYSYNNGSSTVRRDFQWSLDGETWNYTQGQDITLPSHTKVYLCIAPGYNSFALNINNCTSTAEGYPHSIGGDISALVLGTNPGNVKMLGRYAFYEFAKNDTHLINSNEMRIGTHELSYMHFFNAFYGCTGLLTAPDGSDIWWTGQQALYHMFEGSTSLTKGMYLGNIGYMYDGPNQMYSGCSSLNEAWTPALDTYNNSSSQWFNWLWGVASSGKLHRTGGVTGIPASNPSGIPNNWSIYLHDYPTHTMNSGNHGDMTYGASSLMWTINVSSSATIQWVKCVWQDYTDGSEIRLPCGTNQNSGYSVTPGLGLGKTYWVYLEWRNSAGNTQVSARWKYTTPTSQQGFCIRNVSSTSGTLTLTNTASNTRSFRIYLNGASVASSTSIQAGSTYTLSVPSGQTVNMSTYGNSSTGTMNITMDVDHIAYGPIKQLTKGVSDSDTGDCSGLFKGDTHLVDASGIEDMTYQGVKTTNVADHGLEEAFYGCTALLKGMRLDAIETLGEEALNSMYAGCSSLVEARCPNVAEWDSAKTDNWMFNVAVSGTMHANPDLTIPTGASGVPGTWTREKY